MAKREQLVGTAVSQEVADAFPEDIPALLHQYSDNASQRYRTKPADPSRSVYLKTSLSTRHSKGVIDKKEEIGISKISREIPLSVVCYRSY